MMKIQARSIASTLGLVALGVVLGVAGSQRYWFHRSVEMLEAEVVGRANVDVLTLSMWRTGSEEDALAILEGGVDTAVGTTYASRQARGKIANESVTKLFQVAKVYRAVYPPPSETHPSLLQALDSVALPEAKYCSPAIQKLMSTIDLPRPNDL